ncbi:MAG TPA: hypothetical protein VKA84_11795 [Gemmatimonadaceae bacterium]|nr:hypothetical protein [Gemmatimonadaceae bacterium]
MRLPSRCLLQLLLPAIGAACSRDQRADAGTRARAPAAAEFLLSAGDSTYWVRGTRGGLRMRGSPMLLARYGGRFFEVYVADDDRSYYDALFVGQRLYRRDLVTGDSVAVFDDSIVERAARRYARRHPEADPLDPDEDGAEDPAEQATSEIEVLDVHGPYLSYEHHANVDVEGESHRHVTRRGVLDLRSGRAATVRALFGDRAAVALLGEARRRFAAVRDSVRRAPADERARRAAEALDDFTFEERSFGIVEVGREPAVAFLVPGLGDRAGGLTMELPPIPAPAPPWWSAVRETLPTQAADSSTDEWRRGGTTVLASYDDTSGTTFALSVRDSAGGSWQLGRLGAPARQLYWLDSLAVDAATRRGLGRAFNESAFYSEDVRSASLPKARPRRAAAHVRLAAAGARPPVRRHRGARRGR